MIRSRTFRWLVAAALAALIAGVGLRLALLDGWLRTVRIDGPSMAPALCGTHLAVTCGDCGTHFRVGRESVPESGRLVCPNCGWREIDAFDQPVHSGDTVLVDRWPLLTRMPRRWEVVAYDDPHEAGPAVKRIAGMPGEKIEIRGGDLYVGGRIVRKSLAEFWQTAVLVHDDAHRPTSLADANAAGFLRWRPSAGKSRWSASDGGYRWEPPQTAMGELDWLEYVHWRCDASLTPRDQPAAILDNDSYNQALPRRLNELHDLVLTGEVQLASDGAWAVALVSRGTTLVLRLSGDQVIAEQDGRKLAIAPLRRSIDGRPRRFIVGQFDAQLIAAIDGEILLIAPLEWSSPEDEETASDHSRLRIGAENVAMVRNLRVWRDIYLLEPRGTGRPWSASRALGEDEYLMLGDNQSVSIDSRHLHAGGIPRAMLRGIVTRPRRPAP